MSAIDNLRAAAIESLQRTTSRPRALSSFVSKLKSNKVLLAALAEPYLNSVADSMVPVVAHVRSTPSTSDHPADATKSVDILSDVVPTAAGHGAPASPASISVPAAHSHSKRGFGVIAAIQKVVSRSIFDTYRLPDGRSLRQVRWAELPGLADRFGKAGRVLTRIMQHATVPNDTGLFVSDVVGENVVLDAIEEADDHVAA